MPLNSGIAVDTPRVMPLLAERLMQLRAHRVRGGVIDALVVAAAVGGVVAGAVLTGTGDASVAQLGIASIALGAAWAGALAILSAAAQRHGRGRRLEVVPVLHSAAIGLAALAVAAALTGTAVPVVLVSGAIPLGCGALIGIHLLRHTLVGGRRGSVRLASRTLVVGDRAGIEHTVRSLGASGRALHVVGVAGAPGAATFDVDDRRYPVLGTADAAARIAREHCIETVVVAGGGDDPDFVRRLSWSLEGASTDLVLATRLSDVAPARISFDRVSGLALTHVALPRFDHGSRRAKRLLDVVVSALALAPLLLIGPVIALVIALDSPGGVLFRQRRIGRDGREFDILKFRTMSAGADRDRAALDVANEGAGPLFKIRNDPRVTRVGAALRRYSLDELPQFWNVLKGEMSIVGPRPPLPSEVRAYDGPVFRRLYVPPGITGLWQVSGRSDLSWEESVRLDLHYVENWSVATDLKIMLRTAAVLVRPKGAY